MRTTTVSQFRERAKKAIEDERLQGALDKGTGGKRLGLKETLAEIPDAEGLRDQFMQIRSATLAQLADHLETFERNATASGAQVHWARDGVEACEIVIEIARQHEVTLTTKSKSMVSEEISLNKALAEAGIEPVETDLGEWIIQLADEPPFHIVGPAIHKTRHQVAELLSKEAGRELDPDNIKLLTAEARRMLRERFLVAGMGMSGGNIAVAETGSIVLVMNEGNGRMVTSAPPVHVAVVGIEKVTPTWDAAAVWLSLLGRSASGQPLSMYTNIVTGPARAEDPDGPEEVHIVLLDNGRSELVGTKYEEVLQCIRCGACLNFCPVYQEAGGHAYGSPYCGPIGNVLTPLLFGLEDYEALPNACALCDACRTYCPSRIDLPRMLLELRTELVDEAVIPWHERKAEEAMAFVFKHERLMRFATGAARLGQWPFVSDGFLKIPEWLSPTGKRKLPGLAKRSFHKIWQSGDLEDKR
ncbi:lactate utilization protein B [Candidatus Poribacteria bacterium]